MFIKFIKRINFSIYLFIVYVVTAILVNPAGNFPLNDDWAFASLVKNYCENGIVTIDSWQAMTLLGQVFWGALFCKIFGFSFLVLRLSTLTAGFIGVLVFYKLILELSRNGKIAAFASLLLFLNPLYFSLSFTFMTDVHFVTSMLLSVYFFIMFLRENKAWYIILAAVFSVVSTMIRQPGILIPLVFAVTLSIGCKNIPHIMKVSVPFILSLLALIFHSIWMKYHLRTNGNVGQFNDMMNFVLSMDFYQLITRTVQSLLYCGLILFPLLILLSGKIRSKFKHIKLTNLFVLILIVAVLLIGGTHFPRGNIIYNIGLGPKILKDAYFNNNVSPQVNNAIWVVLLKLISIPGSLILLLIIDWKISGIKKVFQESELRYIRIARLSIAVIITGYLSFLIVYFTYFDRYTIPLFTLLMLTLIPYKTNISKASGSIALISLLLFGVFSICASHDYLSWNRARWQAVEYLTDEKGIKPSEIDGGFEFNGWYKTGTLQKIRNKNGKSWWFVDNDKFVISFGDLAGYNKTRSFYYPQVLSAKHDSIYILQKTGPSAEIQSDINYNKN